jgi:DNA segregation ATPase FtsK/SpoIIIE, S-DNA-T family
LEASRSAAETLVDRHGGLRAPVIAALPTHVDYDAVARDDDALDRRALLGVDEQGHTVAADFGQQSHLVILGDNGSGKTAVLRTLCRGIIGAASRGQARLYVMDPRHSLTELGNADHVAGYATTTTQLTTLVGDLVSEADGRMQRRDVRQACGPDLYLVIDDYDVIAAAQANPLTALLVVLPYARDIGLHLIIARRSAGAARALYEPVLAAARELDGMGLQLSAAPDEGPLLGATRPRALPPGRGTLCTRSVGERLIQVAWTAPP